MFKKSVFRLVDLIAVASVDKGNVAVIVHVPADTVDGVAAIGIGRRANVCVLHQCIQARIVFHHRLKHVGTSGLTCPTIAEHQSRRLVVVVPLNHQSGFVFALSGPVLDHVEGEIRITRHVVGSCPLPI